MKEALILKKSTKLNRNEAVISSCVSRQSPAHIFAGANNHRSLISSEFISLTQGQLHKTKENRKNVYLTPRHIKINWICSVQFQVAKILYTHK